MNPAELVRRARAATIFRPSAPVSTREMLVGRMLQINASLDAILEVGRHVAIFGERGVGKTSLANVVREVVEPLEEPKFLVSMVGATTGDSFESLLHRLFSEITYVTAQDTVGFGAEVAEETRTLAADLCRGGSGVGHDAALRFLRKVEQCVLIIDEFDRMDVEQRARFTDLVKALSDAGSRATLIFVGVAESVTSLIDEHLSLGRNLTQVEMPRMTEGELSAIIEKAGIIGLQFDDDCTKRIVRFAQGLPHYAHLLGLNCAYECAARGVSSVTTEVLDVAVNVAIEATAASIRKAYMDATSSAHQDALYSQVLLACALAVEGTDELHGEFRPANVLAPFRAIVGDSSKEISTFNGHLTAFSERETRGGVLIRLGHERNYRFRFADPMLPPYVVMLAHEQKLLPESYVV